jgi:EAL domain-containing protein (putative c-di-GMP-specific phosphodiesterase class I)
MSVVAEGIEDKTQMAALEAMHCEMGQGFLLGMPSSPAAIKGLLEGASLLRPVSGLIV